MQLVPRETRKGGSRVWGAYPERKDHIVRLSKRIRPVFRFARSWLFFLKPAVDGALHFIKPVDPFKIAFTWSPKAGGRARKLDKICDITTYHTWGYYGCFKPSIAEVIAQIPADVLDDVIAFEIVEQPETAADLRKHGDILNEGYHVATTRLYRKKWK